MKPCKDCQAEGITTLRKIVGPGPRCTTHWRVEKKRRSGQSHGKMLERTYGITDKQYRLLLSYQSIKLGNPLGTCAVCGVANGKARRLAVDHDHETGQVRGVVCGPCNKDVLGRLSIEALQRAVEYLKNPPGGILNIESYPPGYPELGG